MTTQGPLGIWSALFNVRPAPAHTGDRCRAMRVGDLNGDSYLDFVVANEFVSGSGTGALNVYLNEASSGTTFTFAQQLLGIHKVEQMYLADLNGDSYLDVVLFRTTMSFIYTAFNLGPASYAFSGLSPILAVSSVRGGDVGDYDADGDLDILYCSSGDFRVVVNTGAGVWDATHLDFLGQKGSEFCSFVVAKGTDELAVATANFGGTPFTFGPPDYAVGVTGGGTLHTGPDPGQSQRKDFNVDGVDDLVMAPRGSLAQQVVLGRDFGGFFPPLTFTNSLLYDSEWVSTADIDNDGLPDFIATTHGGSGGAGIRIVSRSRWTQTMDGPVATLGAAGGLGIETHLVAMAAVDLDNDGTPGLLTLAPSGEVYFLPAASATPRLIGASAAVGAASALVVADFTADAALDIATGSLASGTASLFVAAGDNTFSVVSVATPDVSIVSLAAASVNGDARPDLVIASPSAIYVLARADASSFAAPVTAVTGLTDVTALAVLSHPASHPRTPALVYTTLSSLAVALPSADMAWGAPTAIVAPAAHGANRLVVRDLDADGYPDVLFVADALVSYVLSTSAPGTFGAVPGTPVASLAGPITDVAVVFSKPAAFGDVIVATVDSVRAFMTADCGASWDETLVAAYPEHARNVSGLAVYDANSDGYADIGVFAGTDGFVFYASVPSYNTHPSTTFYALDHPECGGVPGTVACLRAALAHSGDGTVTTFCVPPSVGTFVHCPSAALGDVAFPVTQRLTLVDATIDCTIAGGSSGALFAVYSSLTLRNVTIVGASPLSLTGVWAAATFTGGAWRANVALAGGALARSGNGPVTVSGTVLDANSASLGGTFCATAAPVIDLESALLVESAEFPASTLMVSGALITSAGAYGGIAHICSVALDVSGVDMSSATTSASGGGGYVYVCGPGLTQYGHVTHPSVLPVSSVATPGGYGVVVAGPPQNATVAGLPTSAISGVPLGLGTLTLRDAWGAVVSNPFIRIGVSPLSATGDIEVSGMSLGALYDESLTGYSLGAITLAVGSWPEDVGSSATLAIVEFVDAEVEYARVTVAVGACPRDYGRTSASTAPLVCAECGPNGFSTETSTEPCGIVPTCPDGFVVIDGKCVTCPGNTVRVANTSAEMGTVAPCVCERGFYSPTGAADVACVACPPGGVCAGGTDAPVAAPEYYPTGPAQFSECPIERSCLGGRQCAREYAPGEFMCVACAQNHYRKPDGTCDACPGASTSLFVLFCLLVVGAAVLSFVLVLVAIIQFQRVGASAGRKKLLPHSIGVAVTFLQVLAVLGRAAFKWPTPPVQQVMDSVAFATFDLSLFSTDCTVTSFPMRYALSVGLPTAFFALIVALVVGFKTCRCSCRGKIDMTRVSVRALLYRLIFSFGPIVYLPLARATLLFWDCTQLPDGSYRLDSSLDEECYGAMWLQLLPLALTALAVYVVALPLSFGLVLWKNRHELDSTRVQLAYGPLFTAYRRAHYMHEVVRLLKRLAVVCVALYASNLEHLLFAGFFAIFLSSLVYQLYNAPFFDPLHNTLEAKLDGSILALCAAGVLFWSTSGRSISQASYISLVVATLAVLFGTIVVIAYAVVSELMKLSFKRARGLTSTVQAHPTPRPRWFAGLWHRTSPTSTRRRCEIGCTP
ncbi:uncharacterized protein AMSG_04636 [Thecamonas trahens ATCC 50062]|uniref:Tyrosine-protein kinase ephrin type A/B receptor-like domain-containing protein n=1 Tax=Thecamonas trahens ATCC 50062 TaxID=461836 RepID=A0A0L0D932_THETB|nr:hypothetical protein AMSG_04636 [Thecamonas trahens ATCC 50062]KNC48892.1 hypothetical protein AMSG_04636 [Thecamonas trahens ATCC 50062]|eukprot:XP_013758310.1 hypothetical protein AMSG_04636 [Thecamonas trahens ATCC 50062]